ncbi:MAG: hypothetical protein GY845_06395 [Planctomycetes bacterium]|nr:hypothetical protein [Planctomycetota bacterium]
MKRKFITLFIFSLFILGPVITASADLMFSDDFESYTAGSAPPAPWIQRYNQNSIITSPGIGGAGQSVQLRGAWNWSDTLSVDLTYTDTFTFDVACMVGNGAAGAGQFQFNGTMVSDKNAVWFAPDWNKISWSDGTTIVPYCNTNTWYQASVTISGYLGSSPTAAVTVYDAAGNLLGAQSGLSAWNIGATPQQQFALHTRSQPLNGQGAVAYFDNVRITPAPTAFLLGGIGLVFSSWKLRKRKEL